MISTISSLLGLQGAGFTDAYSTTNASAPWVEARRDDFIIGICSLGSLDPNPGRIQIDRAALMLHSYQMEMLSMSFQMLQCGKN